MSIFITHSNYQNTPSGHCPFYESPNGSGQNITCSEIRTHGIQTMTTYSTAKRSRNYTEKRNFTTSNYIIHVPVSSSFINCIIHAPVSRNFVTSDVLIRFYLPQLNCNTSRDYDKYRYSKSYLDHSSSET